MLYNMNTWEKIAICAGALAAAAGVGYFTYKMIEAHKKSGDKGEAEAGEKKGVGEHVEEKDWESVSGEEEIDGGHKADIVDIMDEVLVGSMECMQRFAEFSSQIQAGPEEERESLFEKLQMDIQELVSSVEKGVCNQKGWNVEEYANEVKAREDSGDE